MAESLAKTGSSTSHYPRVLIVGPNFDPWTGGGITLGNLFHGWPRERLAVVATNPCEVDPAPCGRQYLLGSDEIRWLWPASLIAPGTRQRSVPDCDLSVPRVSKVESQAVRRNDPVAISMAKTAVYGGARWLGGSDAVKRFTCSPRLLKWTQDVRPDLVYAQVATLGLIRLVAQLVDKVAVPLVLHIMDDWPSTAYDHGLLAAHLRGAADREFRRLIELSEATLAISKRMADEYECRYGRAWGVFHNPVDIQRWAKTRRTDWQPRGSFRLIYAGRVGLGIGPSLVDVCRAVESLRQRGMDVRLEVYTPNEAETGSLGLAAIDGVELHGAIGDPQMPAMLAGADLLVLPYDFHGRAAKFACLSFPTKAPAYMATGVPVLVHAPPEHALSLDASERGWAYVVDEPDVGRVADAIERLASDEILRRRLAERAVETSESVHDARIVRERFRSTLAAAAARTNSSP